MISLECLTAFILLLCQPYIKLVGIGHQNEKDIHNLSSLDEREEISRCLVGKQSIREITDHKQFTLATNIKVYLCDPYSPWQRGTNENTNRLLRQYFPKSTDLSVYSQQKLSSVARQLNERPRKTLDYETPAQKFNRCVAPTD